MDSTTHNKIPAYSDHYCGVGGAVINEKDEILLIQEVRSPEPKPWKLPGGFMDPGETIKQACEREVMEETGVKTQFVGIVGMREQLQFRYGATDFYIVCLMSVKAGEEDQKINIIDKREVFAAQWVPLAELSSNSETSNFKMFQNAYMFIKGIYSQYQAYLKVKQPGDTF